MDTNEHQLKRAVKVDRNEAFVADFVETFVALPHISTKAATKVATKMAIWTFATPFNSRPRGRDIIVRAPVSRPF
jgi:hypothetical protein